MDAAATMKPILIAENSFEHNQSFPIITKNCHRKSYGISAKAVENFTGEDYHSSKVVHARVVEGEEYNSYSYRFEPAYTNILQKSTENSSLSDENAGEQNLSLSLRENRKSLLTLCEDNKILTINKLASDLFGYTPAELIGKDLRDLFEKPSNKEGIERDSVNSTCDESAAILPTCGKIVDIVNKKGFTLPVSTWTKAVEDGSGKQCRIVVLEPVERISCLFDFNEQGDVIYCDEKFAVFHGLQASELGGLSVTRLMPSYCLPTPGGCTITKNVRLQHTTSTMSDGTNFSVTVFITSQQKSKRILSVARSVIYRAKLWIFPHVSGMITAKSNGEIQSINGNFAQYLFGYTAEEIARMNVTELIPTFLDREQRGSLYNSVVPQIEMDSSLDFSCQEDDNIKHATTVDQSTIESWVEVSLLSNDPKEKMSKSPDKDKGEVQTNHSNFLTKINALLNNSGGVEDQVGDKLTSNRPTVSNNCCKEASTHSDSAIHSIGSSCKYMKPTCNDEGKLSAQSSFSDYHSVVGGSQNVAIHCGNDTERTKSGSSTLSRQNQSSFVVLEDDPSPEVFDGTSENVREKMNICNKPTQRLSLRSEVTSTPLECDRVISRISNPDSCVRHLQNGFYRGKFKHKHGALIDFSYDLTKVVTENGKSEMICFRIYAQTRPMEYYSTDAINSTILTSTSTLPSLSLSNKSSLLDTASLSDSRSEIEPFEDNMERYAVAGEFSEKFTLVKQIGSGAFGFVQIAKCKRTAKEFVVKFIQKDRILDECWMHDDELDSMIPMEIALLSKFRHPHIIGVVDFFENKSYFSMVMPKHGIRCLDLFEFIDRSSNGIDKCIGEPLSSFIFRQVVSAVSYLHARNILHRDIKDENIIIDENFVCKLIDFGSATFMKPGREFATFCGTIEYCSPEVLMGNKYRGPELEMWALGVTLYTLVFGENPFKDVEETIACELDPPFAVSRDLAALLQWLLQPDPEFRCAMHELLESQWLSQSVDIEEYIWNDVVHTPAGSLNSSRAEKDFCEHRGSDLDEENLCHELEKLTTNLSKHGKQQKRDALKPINNLNNTI